MPCWVDGNALQPAASTYSNTEALRPNRYTSERKAPAVTSPLRIAKHPVKAFPEVRFEQQMTFPYLSIEQIKSSPDTSLTSSPSPVTRHRVSRIRRASLAQKAVSPPNSHSFCHVPVIKEAERRPSAVGHSDRHADTLALAPSPVASFPPSEIAQTRFAGDTAMKDTSDADSWRRLLMSKPRPGRSAFKPVGGRRISHAIEDLEDMVQEAVNIADDNLNRSQVEEIYMIIEDAKNAVQGSSNEPARQLMTGSSPPHVSESTDTRPLPKILPVKLGLQREPTSVDWVYQHSEHTKKPVTPHSTSTSDNGEERSQSRLSTRSDLLLPPEPTQISPREHVDFVLRPLSGEDLRGRPRRRHDGSPPGHCRKHRSRRGDTNRRRKASSRSISAPSRQDQRSPSVSVTDSSIDDDPLPPQRYGRDLHVRDHVHRHMFGLQGNRPRQPIARNWGPGKKRLTATIACINTALLGIMIGVYVSHLLSRAQASILTQHRQAKSLASSTT
jgi:hypothetical protein